MQNGIPPKVCEKTSKAGQVTESNWPVGGQAMEMLPKKSKKSCLKKTVFNQFNYPKKATMKMSMDQQHLFRFPLIRFVFIPDKIYPVWESRKISFQTFVPAHCIFEDQFFRNVGNENF